MTVTINRNNLNYMSKKFNPNNDLLFVPLGGSGEIGMNLNLYCCDGKWIMVDLGMTFADEFSPGIDLVFPDTAFIEERREDLLAIVLTHGHEDHIGAVPYLWERFKVPIYCTAFTAELVRGKLAEAGLLDIAPIHVVKAGEKIDLAPFEVTYVPLAHSIAEGHGLKIKTHQGTIFHTGDFKLDDAPIIGPKCPSDILKKMGDEGVLAMVCDSTNVFNKEESGSEGDVLSSLMELVGKIDGRLAVTTFASNVARLDTIGQVAKAHGRDVVLLGRSMLRIVAAAKATGYLKNFPRIVDEKHANDLPKNKILMLCTGCQGEPRAALARIARDDHRHVSLNKGDTVIFSSKMIPGNEITLGHLFNTLVLRDVNIITEKDEFVHVSGHPGQPELKRMYEWVRPDIAIPVHGEHRHLKKHSDFASSIGVKKTFTPKNGDIVAIRPDGAFLIDTAPHGRLVVDGKVIVSSGNGAIVERRRISSNGLVSVGVILNDDGALVAEPLIMCNGIPGDIDSINDHFLDASESALERMKAKHRLDDNAVEEAVRIAIRRRARTELGKNPVVDVLITREEDIDF